MRPSESMTHRSLLLLLHASRLAPLASLKLSARGNLIASCSPRARAGPIRGMTQEDEFPAEAAAKVLSFGPRPTSGREAFEGTTWSVLMRVHEGGSTIFTVQLLGDDSCRFSDSDIPGSWECERDWVVIEKPKGFFDQTLFFSAKLAPPSEGKPKWRLVDGVVQRSNYTDTNAGAANASLSSGVQGDADSEDSGVSVELAELGSFGVCTLPKPPCASLPAPKKSLPNVINH